MSKSLSVILTLVFIAFQSLNAQQQKRLALVIGNGNYEKGALKNPVNDALLMEQTLKSIGFDVILDTNISTLQEFNTTVRRFGEQREKYNVGFIYYAGHGVQINGENYLLATKEKYESDYDVDDNALSVRKIMRFLTNKTNQVNVLILDACRDNPFESNWNPQARSKDGGQGLAKISAPTGSLIAYSTDAGNTAADGDGKNSIYCVSLTENMQLENTTLDQVFRNVRTDVLKASVGSQRPVEESHLTGEAFYLKKGTFTDDFILIDSLFDAEDYTKGLKIAINILKEDPTNLEALLKEGQLYYILNRKDLAHDALDKAKKIYPNSKKVYFDRAMLSANEGNYKKAQEEIDYALKIDSNYVDALLKKADIFYNQNNLKKALDFYSNVIQFDSKNTEPYSRIANIYSDIDSTQLAINYVTQAISIDPEDAVLFYNRGVYYYEYGYKKEAIDDNEEALKIDSTYVDAIFCLGVIYEEQGKIELALKTYERGIALEKTESKVASYCYNNRAIIYKNQEKFELALADYTRAIELDQKDPDYYINRADLYSELDNYNSAIIDYSKAISIDPENIVLFYNRSGFYYEYGYKKEAIDDLEEALKIDSTYIDAIFLLGVIYQDQGKIELALKTYERGIALEKTDTKGASYCYINRASIYEKQEKFELALADYTKAIELDQKGSNYYKYRAELYRKLDNYNSAIIDISRAIELDPKNTELILIRAKLNIKINDYKLAEKDFKKAIITDPLNAVLISSYALFLAKANDFKKASKQFEKAINIDEKETMIYLHLAKVHAIRQELNKVIADYKLVIDIDKDAPEAYYYLAMMYEKNENLFKASILYTKAINKLRGVKGYFITDENGNQMNESKIYFKRAELYLKADDKEFACDDYKKALELMKEEDYYVFKEKDEKALEEKIKNLCN